MLRTGKVEITVGVDSDRGQDDTPRDFRMIVPIEPIGFFDAQTVDFTSAKSVPN